MLLTCKYGSPIALDIASAVASLIVSAAKTEPRGLHHTRQGSCYGSRAHHLEPVRERVERKQRVTRSSGCHTVRDSDALDRLRPTAVCPAGRALRHRPDGRRVRA